MVKIARTTVLSLFNPVSFDKNRAITRRWQRDENLNMHHKPEPQTKSEVPYTCSVVCRINYMWVLSQSTWETPSVPLCVGCICICRNRKNMGNKQWLLHALLRGTNQTFKSLLVRSFSPIYNPTTSFFSAFVFAASPMMGSCRSVDSNVSFNSRFPKMHAKSSGVFAPNFASLSFRAWPALTLFCASVSLTFVLELDLASRFFLQGLWCLCNCWRTEAKWSDLSDSPPWLSTFAPSPRPSCLFNARNAFEFALALFPMAWPSFQPIFCNSAEPTLLFLHSRLRESSVATIVMAIGKATVRHSW